MSKNAPQISVLTANRLDDGVVVFLGSNGDWIEGIGDVAVARAPEEARALEAQGARDAARNLVVDVYLVEVRETVSGLAPVRTRERVRVAGPSILADVPGYVSPVAVVRQAHHGDGIAHHGDGDRDPLARPRPEPVEGRAPSGPLVVRQAHHEAREAAASSSPAEAA
jgi:hypothetical protein